MMFCAKVRQGLFTVFLFVMILGLSCSASAEGEVDPIMDARDKGYVQLLIYNVIEDENGVFVEGCFGLRSCNEETGELLVEGFEPLSMVILRLDDACVIMMPGETAELTQLESPAALILWHETYLSNWCTDRSFHAYYELNEQCMITALTYYGDMYD